MSCEESDRIGISVYCAVCHSRKKPIGRSAPLEMANSLCDYECDGYLQEPKPGSLWPGERKSEFGYPCSDDATEPVAALKALAGEP